MNLKIVIAVVAAAAITAGFAMPKEHHTDRPSQVSMLEIGD
jgi:hypothetical protein